MTSQIYSNSSLVLNSSDFIKLDSPNPTIHDFSIIENLSITKENCLKNDLAPDTMYIFLLTKNKGAGYDKDVIDFQNQRRDYLGINNIHELSMDGQTLLLSGIRFTRKFIEETQITVRAAPYFFNLFSTDSFSFWELEPEDALRIRHHLRLLTDFTKRVALHPFGKETLIHAFLVLLFEIEALYLKQVGPTPASRQEIHVRNFQNLVLKQFRKVRAIKDYADQLNISAKYLTEIVKQSIGRNASELITEYVINEAKALLKNQDLSIGEIADQLHFSDPSFFGKYFKKQTGLAPKMYRASVTGSIDERGIKQLLY